MVDVFCVVEVFYDEQFFSGAEVTGFFACAVDGAFFHYFPLDVWFDDLSNVVPVYAIIPNIA